MKISAKTQQRLVHRYQFNDAECESKVGEISVDGGKVRLRTETTLQSWRFSQTYCSRQTIAVARKSRCNPSIILPSEEKSGTEFLYLSAKSSLSYY